MYCVRTMLVDISFGIRQFFSSCCIICRYKLTLVFTLQEFLEDIPEVMKNVVTVTKIAGSGAAQNCGGYFKVL